MANLRDLIDYTSRSGIQTSQSLPAVVGRTSEPISSGIATAFAPNFPGSAYRQIKYRGNHCVAGSYQCFWECFMWKPPVGTTFIKFEIWGGGGSGAGSCCCGWGVPGGSGAYAVKCICTGTDLGGCIYEFCLAGTTCVGPDPIGYKGYKTFVNGFGLNNFCAEGGQPGWWACHCNWTYSCMCDYATIFAEGMRHGNGGQPYINCMWTSPNSFDCRAMRGGDSWCSCLTTGSMHGTGIINPHDMYDNTRWCCGKSTGHYDLIGIGNTFGSCGKRVQEAHALNPCYGAACYGCMFCAPFYGADYGARGLPGMVGSPCNMDAGDYCMVNQYVPYPGGLINTRGGYIIRRNSDMNISGNNGHPYDYNDYFGYMGSNRDHGLPGFGGRTAVSHGGNNCYCGGYGGSGQVIITYG